MQKRDWKTYNYQAGFTLKELIVVLIILFILAATASPKFMNIKADANIATLESMGTAIQSAAKLVYAKAAIQGVHEESLTTIDLDGDGQTDVEIAFGYPSASRGNGISQIMGSNFEEDWTWSTTYRDTRFWLTTASLGGRSGQYVNRSAVANSGCYILYDPGTSLGNTPVISYVTDDC